MNLEDYLDEELERFGATPYITHIKLLPESYYRVVTVATQFPVPYVESERQLGRIFLGARNEKRSDLGTFLIDAYAGCGSGVALCHYLDQFNRKRGRIIAKGRLLKAIRRRRSG